MLSKMLLIGNLIQSLNVLIAFWIKNSYNKKLVLLSFYLDGGNKEALSVSLTARWGREED